MQTNLRTDMLAGWLGCALQCLGSAVCREVRKLPCETIGVSGRDAWESNTPLRACRASTNAFHAQQRVHGRMLLPLVVVVLVEVVLARSGGC